MVHIFTFPETSQVLHLFCKLAFMIKRPRLLWNIIFFMPFLDRMGTRHKTSEGRRMPGITPTPIEGGGGGGITVGGGVAVSAGGGGGGGGGGNVINVGGIHVNFDVESLSTENVDMVMRKIYEKLRQATIEGVQLAVAMKNTAAKYGGMAV